MDYSRQAHLLDPESIGGRSISLIGVGATGSLVATQLAQLGWGDTIHGQGVLKVFDGDVVEDHNLANQAYLMEDVGKPKVKALNDFIKRKCGFEVEVHHEMVSNQPEAKATYVFLLTDTMKSRNEIFENILRTSFNTDLVVETRMGLREGRIYAFNPSNQEHVKEWKDSLYDDNAAEVSRCGTSTSIITTAAFVASLAVSRVIQHFNCKYGGKSLVEDDKVPPMWNEVQFALYPESFYLRRFGEGPVIAFP